MTLSKKLIRDIKKAAKFLEEHPDYEPNPSYIWELSRLGYREALGDMVENLIYD